MISITDVEIFRKKEKIIKKLNLEIKQGELVGLIAPNGFGKTTLLRGISSLLAISGGKITINNSEKKNRKEYLQSLFYVENFEVLYSQMTAKDHLEYVIKTRNSGKTIEEIVETFELSDYLQKPVKKYSLGMKQNLILAMYVASDAKVMIFDEPLNGLDPGRIQVINKIFLSLVAEGKTILLSSHDIHNIKEICTRAIFLNQGVIAKDTNKLEKINDIYNALYVKEVVR